jgi:hypothetical protein
MLFGAIGPVQLLDLLGERLPAFGAQPPGKLVRARGEVAFDCAQLVAGNWLFDGEAILEPSYPRPGLLNTRFVPAAE